MGTQRESLYNLNCNLNARGLCIVRLNDHVLAYRLARIVSRTRDSAWRY